MKRVIAVVLLISLCFGLVACGSGLPRKAEDVAEYAISAIFVWGDEVEQLMWVMSPIVKEDEKVAAVARSNYQTMMSSLVKMGYQYCQYRLDSHFKVQPGDPEYTSLTAGSEGRIKSVVGYCYVIEHPTTSDRVIANVYLGKIDGQWYVLHVALSE